LTRLSIRPVDIAAGLYPAVCFRGGSMKLSGGTIEWPKATSRGAKRRAGRGLRRGVPSTGTGVWGCHPREHFEIWDAIWCNLVHFGKEFTFFQFSTFVNENIVKVLDSGIDIVTYYCNFLVVWMPSVSCCNRRL